jgi:hypothetical protein
MLSSPSIQRDSMLVSNLSSLYVFVLLITKQYIMSNSSSILYGCLTGGRLMSYLRYLCVCLCIVVSNTYHVVFFCFACLRLVYPMLPVSLDCPFLLPFPYSLMFIYSTNNFTYFVPVFKYCYSDSRNL